MSNHEGEAQASPTRPITTGEKPLLPVLVLNREASSLPKVAGLGLAERWRLALADVEIDFRPVPTFVSTNDLAAALTTYDTPFLLADGAGLLDPVGIEHVIEAGYPAKSAEVVVFTGRQGLSPLAVLGTTAAAVLASRPDLATLDFTSLIEALSSDPRLSIRRQNFPEPYFFAFPKTEREARAAEWGLLQRLQWRPGGLVAKYLNRPLSIRLSRRLVNTRITPNQTTMAAFALGLVGVVLIALGGYANAVVGALLLQLNSVVDGIDGELARVRHQKSEFGAFLDSICDELLNGAMYAAIGWHLSLGGYPQLLGNDLIPAWLFFPLGAFAGIVSFGYSLIHWHCKLKHKLGFYWWWEAYKPRKQVQRSTSAYTYFKKIFWKESTLFILVIFSLAKLLNIYVVLGVISAFPIAVLLFIHILILRKRW